jgi:hypothetical protein
MHKKSSEIKIDDSKESISSIDFKESLSSQMSDVLSINKKPRPPLR